MARTSCTSPGREPKVRRLSAWTARFRSADGTSATLSFFLASRGGTAEATLRHNSNSASRGKLLRMGLPGKDECSLIMNPRRKKSCFGGAFVAACKSLGTLKIAASARSFVALGLALADECVRPCRWLDRDDSSARYFVLQSGGQLVDIGGRDIYGHAFQQGHAATADHVAPDLDQERLNHIGVEFFGCQAYQVAQSIPYRHGGTIG